MISEKPIGSLKIRVGTFERFTEATADGTTRSVSIENCLVSDLYAEELLGPNIRNEKVALWIERRSRAR